MSTSIYIKQIKSPKVLEIRGYLEGRTYDNRDFVDMLSVAWQHPTRPEVCVYGCVKGDLTHEMNTLIGKALRDDYGFTEMILSRPEGHKASRWATFLYNMEGLDYYKVDLTTLP